MDMSKNTLFESILNFSVEYYYFSLNSQLLGVSERESEGEGEGEREGEN